MTAMAGFDWDADLDSLTGFQKFLDFVEASQSIGRYQLDRHVAPQSTSMPKDIFKPHIVGRIEEYGAFLQALAAEFGVAKLPDYLRTTTRNAIPKAAPIKLIPAIRRRIATVFAEDLDWYESL